MKVVEQVTGSFKLRCIPGYSRYHSDGQCYRTSESSPSGSKKASTGHRDQSIQIFLTLFQVTQFVFYGSPVQTRAPVTISDADSCRCAGWQAIRSTRPKNPRSIAPPVSESYGMSCSPCPHPTVASGLILTRVTECRKVLADSQVSINTLAAFTADADLVHQPPIPVFRSLSRHGRGWTN